MKTCLLFALTLMLAACATTPEERRAQAEREAARLRQTYGPTCERLGYAPDTDPWRDCLLQLENQRLMQQEMMMYRMDYWSFPGYYPPFYGLPRFCHPHGGRTVCH
jgi:hypothetical protein